MKKPKIDPYFDFQGAFVQKHCSQFKRNARLDYYLEFKSVYLDTGIGLILVRPKGFYLRVSDDTYLDFPYCGGQQLKFRGTIHDKKNGKRVFRNGSNFEVIKND
jgi:hypothetical protein